MILPLQLTAIIVLTILGIIFSIPVLIQGFQRRGKGVLYEHSFYIQRAPQYVTLVNFLLIVISFLALEFRLPQLNQALLTVWSLAPFSIANLISWAGIALFSSGLIFMIGGWYSLGKYFSTDAEVLKGHTVCRAGLLSLVMHPAYSGIIQCLAGASLASTSLVSLLVAVFIVAPLWLNRAKYEEQLLIKNLGQDYLDYANSLHWRRLVPPQIPFGI